MLVGHASMPNRRNDVAKRISPECCLRIQFGLICGKSFVGVRLKLKKEQIEMRTIKNSILYVDFISANG